METRARGLFHAIVIAGASLTAASCGGDDERLPPPDAPPIVADARMTPDGPPAPDSPPVDAAPVDGDAMVIIL